MHIKIEMDAIPLHSTVDEASNIMMNIKCKNVNKSSMQSSYVLGIPIK